MTFAWLQLRETKVLAEGSKRAESEAEGQYSKKKSETGALIEKYSDLQKWESVKRLPFTPIMSALEVCVTPEIGLSSLNWELTDNRAGYKAGTLAFTVFSRNGLFNNETLFLKGLKNALQKDGVTVGEISVSQGKAGDDGYYYNVAVPVSLSGKVPSKTKNDVGGTK